MPGRADTPISAHSTQVGLARSPSRRRVGRKSIILENRGSRARHSGWNDADQDVGERAAVGVQDSGEPSPNVLNSASAYVGNWAGQDGLALLGIRGRARLRDGRT